MKNLTYLHVKKLKLYLLFILNKILLKIIIIHFFLNYKDVNIIIFLTYTKIIYFIYKKYNL